MGEIGDEVRESLVEAIKENGKSILVHNNFNSPDQSRLTFTTRGAGPINRQGLEATFWFEERVMIDVGTVLQVTGSRDYWQVIDTEDMIMDDIFIKVDVRTVKIDASGKPRQSTQAGVTTYNLHGSQSRVNVNSVDNSINISNGEAVRVFAGIREVTLANVDPGEHQAEILDSIGELEEAYGKPTFIDKYKEFMSAAADHIQVYGSWLVPLAQLLNAG